MLDKATADEPGERFPSAAEFAAALVQVCPPPTDPDGALAAWLLRVAPEAMGARETSPGATPQTGKTPPGPRLVHLPEDPPQRRSSAGEHPHAHSHSPSDPPALLFGSIAEAADASRKSRSRLRLAAAIGVLLALLLPLAAVFALGRGGSFSSAAGLHAPEGEVRVRSNPAGAEVYVDGVLRGETPLVLALPPGHHAVRVGSARLEKWRATELNVRENVQHQLEVDLTE